MTMNDNERENSEGASFADKLTNLIADLVKRGRVLTALLLAGAAGGAYAIVPSSMQFSDIQRVVFKADDNLFPETMYLWTYDSTSPEGQQVQHKEIHLKGTNTFKGTYAYREIASHGLMTGFRRIGGGTINLTYGSEDPNADSLGSVTLRRVHFVSDKEPPLWIGFETGHDCTCGDGLSHEGPFTSLPAILSTSLEPPQFWKDQAMKVKTKTEDFIMPEDVVKLAKK
jgi:hypothetical protein